MTYKHKKVRFSKRNIKKLHHYPSSKQMVGKINTSRQLARFCVRCFSRFLGYSTILFLFLSLLLIIVLKVGLSGDILARKMETTLQSKLVHFAQTKINDASLSFDENNHLALEAHNILLNNIKGGIEIESIGVLRLGLASWPLLTGNIKVSQFEIADSRIRIPDSNNRGFIDKIPQNSSGHIDVEAISLGLFKIMDNVFLSLNTQETKFVLIRNVTVDFSSSASAQQIYIKELNIQRENNTIVLTGSVVWKEQEVTLEATINNSISGSTDSFVFLIKNLPFHLGADNNIARKFADGRPNNNYFRSRGIANIALQGTLSNSSSVDLGLTLSLERSKTDIAQDDDIETSGEINLTYQSGNDRFDVLSSYFILGSLYLPLKGTIPFVSHDVEHGVYGFNIYIDDGAVKPEGINAPRLDFNGEIRGQFYSHQALVDLLKFRIETKSGKIEGQGDFKFAIGSPQAKLDVTLSEMTTADIKQLWPINLSPSARQWVISHVAGGIIRNGNLKVNFPQGIFNPQAAPPILSENEITITGEFYGVSTLLVGDLPPLRKGDGRFAVKGRNTEIFMENAISYIDNEKNKIEITEGYLFIPWRAKMPMMANISGKFKGKVSDIIKIIELNPINAKDKVPFQAEDVLGEISGSIKIQFPLMSHPDKNLIDWSSEILFDKLSLISPLDGNIHITEAKGKATLSKSDIVIIADANLNEIPANINLFRPMGQSDIIPKETIRIQLTDDIRKKLMPSLNTMVTGTVALEIGAPFKGARPVKADVTNAEIILPWVGWTKGKGIAGEVNFAYKNGTGNVKTIELQNFSLKGASFNIAGNMLIQNGALYSADLSRANLNRGDSVGLTLRKDNNGYRISANGQRLDARALIKMISSAKSQGQFKSNDSLEIIADIDNLSGFYDQTLSNAKLKMVRRGTSKEDIIFSAMTQGQRSITANIRRNNNSRDIVVTTNNAGGMLRFMDIYDKIHGGILQLSLKSNSDGTLKGPVNLQNFQIVDEPRLASLVSSKPNNGGKSLNQAVNGKLDVSIAQIETASAQIGKGDNFLVLDEGVIRGKTIGATFQGIIYDASGNISMTGTFMPAYGINRVFGEVPLLGAVLGNGRDRGLIGITFKIEGKAREPKVTINPISAIAPGIFRQIFEYKP